MKQEIDSLIWLSRGSQIYTRRFGMIIFNYLIFSFLHRYI